MPFRLRNAKGLFHETELLDVITEEAFARLRDAHVPSIEDPEKRAAALEIVALLGELPIAHANCFLSEADSSFDPAEAKANPSRFQTGIVPARCWLRAGLAKSSSPSEPSPFGDPASCGWIAAAALSARQKDLELLLRAIGAYECVDLDGAPAHPKRAAAIAFEPLDAERDFAQCSAWALCAEGGFLDSKGQLGPLSRARMFESPEAAARAGRGPGRGSGWTVVEACLAVVKAVAVPGGSSNAQIDAAIALQEAKALDKALEDAGVERLRAKLAELEALVGSKTPPAALAPKNRL